jgi:hypothetical protein
LDKYAKLFNGVSIDGAVGIGGDGMGLLLEITSSYRCIVFGMINCIHMHKFLVTDPDKTIAFKLLGMSYITVGVGVTGFAQPRIRIKLSDGVVSICI